MKKKKKNKVAFSPAMMVFKWLAGLVVSSFAVTGVGFVDSVIWKVAIFIASTLATTIVGSMYSSQMIKSKVAGGEARIVIFTLLLYICYLVISIITQFAGTMPLWAFIIIFAIFVTIIAALGLFVYVKQQEKALIRYYTQLDEEQEREQKEALEKENERNKRLGKNKVIDLTKDDKIETFTLAELWESQGKEKGELKAQCSKDSIEYIIIRAGADEQGKFYGKIKFLNYDIVVKGEVLFSDKPIWFV